MILKFVKKLANFFASRKSKVFSEYQEHTTEKMFDNARLISKIGTLDVISPYSSERDTKSGEKNEKEGRIVSEIIADLMSNV